MGINRKVKPLYVVIDTSKSMGIKEGDKRRIDLAMGIPQKLFTEYQDSPSLDSKAQVSLITFNVKAQTPVQLGSFRNLNDMKTPEPEGNTWYSAAFQELKERFDRDLVAKDGHPGWDNPAVIFVTDGRPNDPEEVRERVFRELVPVRKHHAGFSDLRSTHTPQMIMMGISSAGENTVLETSEGNRIPLRDVLERFASADNVHLAPTGIDIETQIKAFVQAIVETVVESLLDLEPEATQVLEEGEKSDWLKSDLLAKKLKDIFDGDGWGR